MPLDAIKGAGEKAYRHRLSPFISWFSNYGGWDSQITAVAKLHQVTTSWFLVICTYLFLSTPKRGSIFLFQWIK
jgi:hypothetical protein